MNETNTLKGQVAVVTGAGIGIGFGICRRFCQAGARVLLNDVDVEAAERAVEKLAQEGWGDCVAFGGDVSDPETIEQMVSTAVARFGRIDVAIANAGITSSSPFLQAKPAALRRMLELNLQGSFFLAQAAARRMVEAGTGGRILFLSSVVGHQAHWHLAGYGMTKAALQMLAKALVPELAPHGITTNAISPGAVVTERTVAGDAEFGPKWQTVTPSGKVAGPSDIANAALFLASPAAAQITGQTLVVDGGWTAVSPTPDFTIE